MKRYHRQKATRQAWASRSRTFKPKIQPFESRKQRRKRQGQEKEWEKNQRITFANYSMIMGVDLGIREPAVVTTNQKGRRCLEGHLRGTPKEIGKKVVTLAQQIRAIIAVEDLRFFRKTKWPWRKMLKAIHKEAAKAWLPVVKVDPSFTSQTCPKCSHVSKDNRIQRDLFHCISCGYESHADMVAARNIAVKGAMRAKAIALRLSGG